MRLTLVEKEDGYKILEEGREIYSIREEKEDDLLSIYLVNLYGDDTFGFFQIGRTFFDKLRRKSTMDFTLYDKDTKLGELHKNKEGYDLSYGDAMYRFFGGKHMQKYKILCIDRDEQIADFTFDGGSNVVFQNESSNALFALLLYMFHMYIKEEFFVQEAFVKQYRGVYVVQ